MLTTSERNIFYNLCDETHVMIGGTTGSGKSTLIHDIISCLTSYTVETQQIVLIDLKRIELFQWRDDPHTLETATEPEDVNPCLDRVIDLMERRYTEMMKAKTTVCKRSHVHVIIDEVAEVLKVRGVEKRLDKLLRLARAAHIHLVMATQAINRKTVPADIQANITCLIGLRCRSAIESRQIIGQKGCEVLPKYGKAYILNSDGLQLIDIPVATKNDFDITKEAWYEIA